MHRRLHPLAYALGLSGLIPFIGCGLAALALPEPQATRMLAALIAYGAVILAFLGGVHWGIAMIEQPPRAEAARYGLGVLPSLAGWLALLLPMLLPANLALVVLILGFALTIGTEARGRRRGLVPAGYMPLRWILTVTVLLVLACVLVARLLGIHFDTGNVR